MLFIENLRIDTFLRENTRILAILGRNILLDSCFKELTPVSFDFILNCWFDTDQFFWNFPVGARSFWSPAFIRCSKLSFGASSLERFLIILWISWLWSTTLITFCSSINCHCNATLGISSHPRTLFFYFRFGVIVISIFLVFKRVLLRLSNLLFINTCLNILSKSTSTYRFVGWRTHSPW